MTVRAADNGGLRILNRDRYTQNIFQLVFRKKDFIDNKPGDKHEMELDIEGAAI
jgi:hypothetical protein